MLFYIDDSIMEIPKDIFKNYAVNFQLIAMSRKLGNHFGLGSRKVLEYLIFNEDLDPTTKAIYKTIFLKLAHEKSIMDYVEKKINIVYNIDETDENISIDRFTDLSIVDKNVLLLEDRNDEGIIKVIVDYYLKSKRLPFKVNWHLRNGGGQNTHREFFNIPTEENRFLYCIVDSDMSNPNGCLGSTANDIKSHVKPLTSDYCILPVREAENLTPYFLLNDIRRFYNKKDNDVIFDKIVTDQKTEIFKYLDFKKGLKKGLLKFGTDSDKEFWSDFIISNNNNSCSCPTMDDCTCASPEECNGLKKCCNFIIHEWGSNFLKEAVSYMKINISNIISNLDCEIKEIWDAIAIKLVDFFCLPQRLS